MLNIRNQDKTCLNESNNKLLFKKKFLKCSACGDITLNQLLYQIKF